MNRVSVDVLSNIIERLPLFQKFQLFTVNKLFVEASKWALSKHQSLISLETQYVKNEPYKVECKLGGHSVDIVADFISYEWFEDEETETAKYILSHLPGLKVAFLDEITEEAMEYLHNFCPKLECFVIVTMAEPAQFYKNPNLYHFVGKLKGDGLRQLKECYPSLTGIGLKGLHKLDFQSSFFREGIRNLDLLSCTTCVDTIFSSPAMKTVEKINLKMDTTKTDLKFRATNLKEIAIETELRKQPALRQLCTSLGNSLSSSPELRHFSFTLTFHETVTWEMPTIMFQSMTKLVKICLPQNIKNTDEVLDFICSQYPLLEEISIGNVCGSKKKKILDLIRSFSNLRSLTINNEHVSEDEEGLSPEELDVFVDGITVNGKLKYPFTLVQYEHFPEDLADEQPDNDGYVVWKGVEWWSTTDYTDDDDYALDHFVDSLNLNFKRFQISKFRP